MRLSKSYSEVTGRIPKNGGKSPGHVIKQRVSRDKFVVHSIHSKLYLIMKRKKWA